MKKKKIQQERVSAVQRYVAGEDAVSICASLGRSHRWLYKWLARHIPDDSTWYEELSRRPLISPNRTPAEIEQIVELVRSSLYNKDLFCGSQAIRWEMEDSALAANGQEAVQKARDDIPDLIILDIMMPVMDGYESCRLIKADPENNNIPIIMVTALHDREAKLKGLSASANEFLSEPVDRSELTIRVKNLLNDKGTG